MLIVNELLTFNLKKAMLEEQKEITLTLEKEYNGWIEMAEGKRINHLSKHD
jgi:hypothetical protein